MILSIGWGVVLRCLSPGSRIHHSWGTPEDRHCLASSPMRRHSKPRINLRPSRLSSGSTWPWDTPRLSPMMNSTNKNPTTFRSTPSSRRHRPLPSWGQSSMLRRDRRQGRPSTTPCCLDRHSTRPSSISSQSSGAMLSGSPLTSQKCSWRSCSTPTKETGIVS